MPPTRSMPHTLHDMQPMLCVSALQKSIRRGEERAAMEFASELVNTSRQYCTMVCKRLEIIAHEDVDCIAHPWVIPFVHTATAQARDWYESPDPGNSRMAIGNVIRLLCRTPKSREGDHFQAAIGLRNLLGGGRPEIPDHAIDMHTSEGKRLGRGLDHFRTVGALLQGNPPKDAFEDEAYEMWAIKRNRTAKDSLFNGEIH